MLFSYVTFKNSMSLCCLRRFKKENLSGVGVKILDCDILVSEFEFESRYYVYFRTYTLRKGINYIIFPIYGLNSTIMVLLQGWNWYLKTLEGW